MGSPAIDYAALAKQAGAFKSAPPPAPVVAPTPPPTGAVDYGALAKEAGAVEPPADFKTTNEPPSASLWEKANTPLIPQIKQASHAIADYLDQPRLGDAELNDHITGLGTLSASLRGGAAGMVEGTGDLLSGFSSSVGLALLLSGLTGEGALAKGIPGIKTLLELPAVRALQRVVQGTAGAAFAGHGGAQVITDPTLAGKARGVVEAATGALGVASALPTPRMVNPNPAEAAAAQFGLDRGVPVDAGMATGNKAVKGVQFLSDRSLGGSLVAGPAREAQTTAMTKVGGDLADQARGASITPEQAGQGIRDALASKQQAHTALADASYEKLRVFEADPKNQRMVPVRWKPIETATDTGAVDAGGQPITQTQTQPGPVLEKMGLPVHTTAAKAAIKPFYDQMRRQMPVTQQQASPALKAMQNILEGPEWAPLSQVDRDLSAIKAIAREKGGLAKIAASKLDAAVQQAATNGGPDVIRALHTGRQATIAKVQTEDLIGALPGGKLEEPLAVFQRATAPKDGGIELLRAIKEHTPQALPQIARAKLEDLLSMAPDKQFAEWGKVGSETKRVLFPQAGQAQALDHFFLLAKKLAENPNPSGTAYVGAIGAQGMAFWTNPIASIIGQTGAAGLSAMLHSPKVTQALTRTLVASRSPAASGAARGVALASLASALRRANLPALEPVFGQDESRPETAGLRK